MAKLKDILKMLYRNLFASMPLSIFLMIVYAIAIGWATFIEKDYGTLVAQDVIYHSWWFEGLNVWLLLNILGCMYLSAKHNLKINVILFHASLVVIILGAGITRHFGFEGRMTLSNGQESAFVLSSDKFLNVLVSNEIGSGGMSDIRPLDSFKEGYKIFLSPYVRYSSFSLDTEVYDKPLKIKSLEVLNYSLASLYNDTIKNNREIANIDKNELDSKMKENHYVAQFEVEYDGVSKKMVVSNGGEIASEIFGNRIITLSWGPKNVLLPFALKLERFEVTTYPGSRMESSFASYVEVIDSERKNFEYKIYMNNVLDYRGYRFFQSEYLVERDENGMPIRDDNGLPIYTATILSVNNDPGKVTTYIGYTLMILGAIWLLFDSNSRFRKLSNFLKSQKPLLALLVGLSFMFSVDSKLMADSIESTLQDSKQIIESKIAYSPSLANRSHVDSPLPCGGGLGGWVKNHTNPHNQNTKKDSINLQNLDFKNVEIPTPQPPSARDGGYPHSAFKEIKNATNNIESSTKDSNKNIESNYKDSIKLVNLESRFYKNTESNNLQNIESQNNGIYLSNLGDLQTSQNTHLMQDSKIIKVAKQDEIIESKSQDSKDSNKKDSIESTESTQQKDDEKLNNFMEYNKILTAQSKELEPYINDMSKEAIDKRIENLKKIPKKYLESFASLQVQGMDGRVKLLDTLSDEIMRKIVGANHFAGLKHNEFLLGLMVMPQDMVKLQLIKVKNAEIRNLLGITNSNYVSFEDLFYPDKLADVYKYALTQDIAYLQDFQNAYKLYHFSNIALKKRDADRNEFDKEILKIDEKMDILLPFSIWNYLKIFPEKGDSNWKVLGNVMNLQHPFTMYFYHAFATESRMGIVFDKWDSLQNSLNFLHNYQRETGGDLYLDSTRVKSELFLNHTDIFPISQYFYLGLGILLFFIALIAIISNKKIPKWLGKGIYYVLLFVFLAHTLGLLLRWYIGGHAPWSNAYESMLYIAWASALSGIIILRKSYFALCGAAFLAGMALLVAHWGFMDPYIGNLQPVLQSYWLNIHVAIIVASYGFLGLSLMLGIINLILFIFRAKSRPQVDSAIISLTAINEMSMTIGILMLITGTFLGGVWANESWGRYWSWDSKETWSLVSVGVYAVVLHTRFLKPIYQPYVFNVLSVVAFYSILMTYFGVNYYLATGMHSYGRGDTDVVSARLYVAIALTLILIALSFFRRKLIPPKEIL
ncbi:cytochrome c biogenesis protein CcsA [Helicobacter saguini]|uniref:cytochrome c biogenesis protein CcsA n=1 Tax=Helicobacter saguini TaxID=1548018 RepID=UPI001EEDB51A|nr:cytochrome c biogenesis protein CcsA [Helicobacter saguini]